MLHPYPCENCGGCPHWIANTGASAGKRLPKNRPVIELVMGNSSSATPSYSWSGLLFGQAMGARAYTKSLNFDPVATELQGKSYVVTGGSSGIGKSVVESLYRRGAKVFVLCRNKDRGLQAAEELRTVHGDVAGSGEIVVEKCDCGDPEQLRHFAEQFTRQKRPLHGLVNNAGALLTERRVNEVNGLESHVACHVVGLHALTKYLRPALQLAAQNDLEFDDCADEKKKEGAPYPAGVHVVNVASAGLYTAKLNLASLEEGFKSITNENNSFDGALVYAVCKRAQLELTHKWAEEMKEDNITVSCMHPGWVQTDGLDGLFELHPSYKSWYSNFREARDGADTIVWLLAQPRPQYSTIQSGQFWFDREIAAEHQWFAQTCNTQDEADALWAYAERNT